MRDPDDVYNDLSRSTGTFLDCTWIIIKDDRFSNEGSDLASNGMPSCVRGGLIKEWLSSYPIVCDPWQKFLTCPGNEKIIQFVEVDLGFILICPQR